MNAQVLVGVKGAWKLGSRNCPVQALFWTDANGTLCFQGTLSLENLGIHELLTTFDPDLVSGDDIDPMLVGFVDDLIGPLSMEIDVLWKGEVRSFELATRYLDFRSIRRSAGSAVVMRLVEDPTDPPKSIQPLLDGIGSFRKALCLKDLVLAYRRGQGISLSDLAGSNVSASLPKPLTEMEWLLVSRFEFEKGSKSALAMRDLLGREELDFYLGAKPTGAGAPSFVASLSLPEIQTKTIAAKGLYILIGLEDGSPQFELHGTVEFAFLDGVAFTVDCSFTTTSFTLSAEMQIGTKASFAKGSGPSIFDLFTLENAGILIGYDVGLTFGVFATITVCRQMVFGAAILTVEGEIPVPRLVSGAIDPVSLPTLFANATGNSLEGLEAFDFLSIERFDDFHLKSNFRQEDLENRDCRKVAEFFNANVAEASLALDGDALQIRPRVGGWGLVDQKRMRHYFVDEKSGRLFLQPQFYVSEIDTTFGSFSVKSGIFLAGKITVLGKSFETVLSLSKESGILAYAKLDAFELEIGTFKVFQVGASKDPTPKPAAFPQDSLVSQFVPEHATGPVFFLSASKKEVAFHFDGHLEFLTIFEFDARIVYCSRRLSVHAEVVQWGIRVFVLLDADYSNLLSADASLKVKLQLDTKGLTEKLDAVTKALDEAVQKLKTTMSNAQGSLDSAQRNVDQLRGQITHMNDLIRSCREAIDHASWWKKAFVAIAKGAEIGAYEVAKAGIWTAIGVATAALELAKLAVSAFGHLSVGLLDLVNATIRAATSLLFLRSAEISASISAASQKFSASIAFVALGEEYEFDTEVELDILNDGLLKFLSDELLEFLKTPRENVANGKAAGPGAGSEPKRALAMRSFVALDARDAPSDEIPDIHEASTEVSRLSSILLLMQTRYRERLGEDLAEFSRMNTSFASALNVSGNAMSTASQAADSAAFKDLAEFVGMQDMDHLDSESRATLEGALKGLNDSIDKHVAAKAAINATEAVRSEWAARSAAPSPTQPEDGTTSEKIDGMMADFLEELEREIHDKYPEEFRDTGFIDLSQERSLKAHFQATKSRIRPDLEAMDASRPRPALRTAVPTYRARL